MAELNNPNFEVETRTPKPSKAELEHEVRAARLEKAADAILAGAGFGVLNEPHPLNCSPWERVARDFPRLTTKNRRRRMADLSLNDQLQAWAAVAVRYPSQAAVARDAINTITKRISTIEKQTPNAAWFNDAKGIPAARGGAWPPGARPAKWDEQHARDGHRMMRARGEDRLYPAYYVGSRGFTYEIELQALYGNRRTQHLLADPAVPDDGYKGGILTIYDFHPSLRKQYRKKANGKHGASNTIDRPNDYIND